MVILIDPAPVRFCFVSLLDGEAHLAGGLCFAYSWTATQVDTEWLSASTGQVLWDCTITSRLTLVVQCYYNTVWKGVRRRLRLVLAEGCASAWFLPFGVALHREAKAHKRPKHLRINLSDLAPHNQELR